MIDYIAGIIVSFLTLTMWLFCLLIGKHIKSTRMSFAITIGTAPLRILVALIFSYIAIKILHYNIQKFGVAFAVSWIPCIMIEGLITYKVYFSSKVCHEK